METVPYTSPEASVFDLNKLRSRLPKPRYCPPKYRCIPAVYETDSEDDLLINWSQVGYGLLISINLQYFASHYMTRFTTKQRIRTVNDKERLRKEENFEKELLKLRHL
jgi:hypothetical protein